MPLAMNDKTGAIAWQALGILLVAVLYYPSLHGPFLLDDFAWFPLLSLTSPSPFTLSFWNYSLTGDFPLGRVVSMATFALQSPSWPEHPEHFKAINLALHVVNYLLLLSAIRHLLSQTARQDKRKIWRFAFLAATLWAISPSNVGAVAYAIQRMNLLAAMFSLVTLIAYFRSRQSILEERYRTAACWGAAGGVALMLGLLSKENAAVVALLISLVEYKLPAPSRSRLFTSLRRFIIVSPWLLLAIFMASHFQQFLSGYASRDFSAIDRLALAPESLFRYVKNFFFPTPRDLSLFQDDVMPPDGALWPLLLLGAWIGLILLVSRMKGAAWQLVAIGMFWFLSAHAMETISIIPLELYFPHRNYFPSMGLAIAAIALLSLGMHSSHDVTMKRITVSLAGVLVAGMLFISFVEARTWADKDVLVEQWYESHPASNRAAQEYAALLVRKGNLSSGARILAAQQAMRPHDILTTLEKAAIQCAGGEARDVDTDWKSMTSDHLVASVSFLADFADAYASNSPCQPFSTEELRLLAGSLLERPNSQRVDQGIWLALSTLAMAEGRYEEAAFLMDKIYLDTHHPFRILDAARLLEQARGPQAAKSYLLSRRTGSSIAPRDLLQNAMIDAMLVELDSRGIDSGRDRK